MYRLSFYIFVCFMSLSFSMNAQVSTKQVENIQISSTKAVFLGKTIPVRDAAPSATTPTVKKQHSKIDKKVPDNFKGRKNRSSAVDFSKEHQGVDPVLQTKINRSNPREIEVLVNARGLGQGSPNDPTGDVSDRHYVQAVNSTPVGVYGLDGTLEMSFSMSTLWADLGFQSFGDPIILYDETIDRWILTEFASPNFNMMLVAVSETDDPLGSYNAYSFSTPNFPDYPKFGVTPEALQFTTNEEGRGTLTQYFINKAQLVAGEGDASIQRIVVPGSNGTEQGFYVSTPVDWNGTNLPFDNNPIVLRLNDSSWFDGPDVDGIELYSFEIDFDNQSNTRVIQTFIPTAPFDAFPCSASGAGFSCVPQLNGTGLDAVPEVIMNVPHQRNFGTHESLVYTFVTDVTNGQNRAGVRWVELRRTSAEDNWSVYQEGTFAPDDDLERFMSSVAIDEKGNICLGYNVSSLETFAGIRATGRNASDPLGEMTYQEVVIQEGQVTINSGGRFGDYSQMSVAPGGLSEFWFTGEYAGANTTNTSISALRLAREENDLSVRSFISTIPTLLPLSTEEDITVEVVNGGENPLSDFTLELEVDGVVVSTSQINETLQPDEVMTHTFSDQVDISAVREYNFRSFVTASSDEIQINDTINLNFMTFIPREAQISGTIIPSSCDGTLTGTITLENLGAIDITSAVIAATVNGTAQAELNFNGLILNNQNTVLDYSFPITDPGTYTVEFEILSTNGIAGDENATNDMVTLETEAIDQNSFITVNLTTDNFAAETSYTIVSATTGEVVAEFVGSAGDSGNLIESKFCVDLEDCYTLILSDAYGDGICCSFGNGSLSVTDNMGNTIAFSDGNFGLEEVIEFCAIGQECSLEAQVTVMDSESPTANTGSILISASNGIQPFTYSINGGVTFVPSNVFINLEAGDYDIVVRDANESCAYEETVTVGALTSTYQIEGVTVNVDILPNPTDGVFKINVSNLPTVENYLLVEIYDIQGKLIQQREIGKFDNDFIGTFSLYAYPTGTYLVRIATPEVNILEKVIRL